MWKVEKWIRGVLVVTGLFVASGIASELPAQTAVYGKEGGFVLNPYLENWECIPGTTILGSDENCYIGVSKGSNTHVGLYRLGYEISIVEHADGHLYWYVGGDGRGAFGLENGPDGGECGVFDSWMVFRSGNGPLGRKGTNIKLMNTCVEETIPKNGAWHVDSGFYDSTLGSAFAIVTNEDTGSITTITHLNLKAGQSANGWSNFTWSNLLETETPAGLCSGVGYRFTTAALYPSSVHSSRWVGYLGFRAHTSVSGCSDPSMPSNGIGSVPFYVDWAANELGILLNAEGWWTIPIGSRITGFDRSRTKGNALNGDGTYTLPDEVLKEGGARINQIYEDPSGDEWAMRVITVPSRCGTDEDCMRVHEPCTPGQDNEQQQLNPPYSEYIDRKLNNFNGSVGASTYPSGSQMQIRPFDPLSNRVTGSWIDIGEGLNANSGRPLPADHLRDVGFNPFILHISDTEFYVYRGSKHTICDDTWDIFPKATSGLGLFWQRLSFDP